jgi:transposase-like protein
MKIRASILRQDGMTHREIAKELGVGVGTAHEWTRGINLSVEQKAAAYIRLAARIWTPERRIALRESSKNRLAICRLIRQHSREELLYKIVNFYNQNGRIPLKREFNMYREYKREFGGWNRAIRMAGFDANPELFAHRFKSSDGHSCDSFTERIIDNWLSDNNFIHQKNWHYGDTKMTADFFLDPGTVIEFFGLAGTSSKYNQTIVRKREFCGRFGLRLIEIYPADIFPKNNLMEKFSPPINSSTPAPVLGRI